MATVDFDALSAFWLNEMLAPAGAEVAAHVYTRLTSPPSSAPSTPSETDVAPSEAVAAVEMVGGVNYERITAEGLWVSQGEQRRDLELIPADTVVLCAGQEPLRELEEPLRAAGVRVHLIGGALEAGELDAKRAILQGSKLALAL